MRKVVGGLLGISLASGLGLSLSPAAVAAPPADSPASVPSVKNGSEASSDELVTPLEQKRRSLRAKAVSDVLSGRAKPVERNGSTVVKVGQAAGGGAFGGQARNRRGAKDNRDQYVELAREKTDRIFVILAEFGNDRDPRFPDKDTDPAKPGPQRFDGPLHNQIPAPDRAVDNSTVWQPDYSREHYQDLYFGEGRNVESVKTYYQTQSSGRYSVDGTVTDWVKVKYNEARNGRSGDDPTDDNGDDPNVCGSNVCNTSYDLVRDAANQWVADQEAQGRSKDEIVAELKTFDQWDRYDFDGDGNFNEPDGYLDHFQIVHAGGDEADGDPYQAEDAIWSHRAFAYGDDEGDRGPTGNLLGGTEIGDTGLWIGDYTIQPENGGLSVFTHEYGHDLGLPDHYDTAGGDNGVEWWNLMAQSRLSAPGEAIGTRPGDLSAWDKLQLGWLDYEIVPAGTKRTLVLGPHEFNSSRAQAIVMPLPLKRVTTEFGAPASGTSQWFSGQGNDLNNTLTRSVTLGAGTSTLSFQARWNIEDCGPDPCDYAYVEVDPGTGFQSVPGSITKPAEQNGIDGTRTAYTRATFNLSAYAGKKVSLRIRYQTDGAAQGNDPTLTWSGIQLDDLSLVSGGRTVFTDDAERTDPAWTASGFTRVGARVSQDFANYYIMSNRVLTSYDRWLASGPYNFGFVPDRPDFVEHFSYTPGLLISYWDTSQSDNNTSQHPGAGLILPVDAHSAPLYRIDGNPWRSRVQVYDATFSRRRARSMTLHVNGQASFVRGQNAVQVFDDRKSYWNAAIPQSSVKVPNAGVRLRVLDQRGTTLKLRIVSTK